MDMVEFITGIPNLLLKSATFVGTSYLLLSHPEEKSRINEINKTAGGINFLLSINILKNLNCDLSYQYFVVAYNCIDYKKGINAALYSLFL
jgi:hypothetical protein